MLPIFPPLLVLFLIIGGVIAAPSGLPEIALWLLVIALYATAWIFLMRDARRLANEAAAIDRWFRGLSDDIPFDDGAVTAPPRRDDEDEGGGRGVARDGPVLAVAGRPIDERDAGVPRFPLTAVADVRARLDRYMASARPMAVVCSAACGADLLALDVAEARRVRRRVVLPCERGRFRHVAVTSRPGTWGPLFDRILGGLPSQDVVAVGGRHDSADTVGAPEPLASAILDHAATLARAAAPAARNTPAPGGAHGVPSAAGALETEPYVIAVIVWEGRSPRDAPESDDPLAAFRAEAERRGIRVDEILTV